MTEPSAWQHLWAGARVGDRLPPADWPCGAEKPDGTWVCSRANDHDGTRHVATVATTVGGMPAVEVVAVWDGNGARLPSLAEALTPGGAAAVLGHPALRRPA